jgi:curved DNA-binding protein CbpA
MEATLYDVLGVPPTATDEELRTAYRRCVRSTHPDHGGSAEEFREVQAAWELLRDAEQRERYDAWLRGLDEDTPPTADPSWGNDAPGSSASEADDESAFTAAPGADPTMFDTIEDVLDTAISVTKFVRDHRKTLTYVVVGLLVVGFSVVVFIVLVLVALFNVIS